MDGNSEQLQVINLKQLPIIEERLRDVKAKIEQRTSAVMALAVTEETRTDVKKIRTEVRKELEGYEAQRMAVKKAIMTPYEQFEAVYKECVSNPYIQLALRSGQYKDLDVMVIKQGEYMGKDPETGKAKFQFIEDDDERETLPTIGYMAYFEYLNGFRKVVYWSKEKMMTHADTFSKAFSRQGYEDLMAGRVPEKDMWRYSSFWYKNFDDMAKKTLLRHIISRWGIMSIEMTTALEHDDAVNVADDGQIVTETVEAARASIPADAQEVPSTEPEAPAPTSEAEPEAVDISAL